MDALSKFIGDPFVSGIFIFVGYVSMILEVFVPSGGVLGLVSLASSVFGIYSLFYQGHPIIALIAIAFYIASFFAMFKFMMRRLNFSGSLPPDTSTSVDRRITDLVGREGVALTPLRPARMARIDGRKIDVVTLGDFIDKDVPVRVVDNSGNRVVVRQIEQGSDKS